MGINTNKDFDQIFREKLRDHEVTPPEFVWSNIQASGLNAPASTSSNWKWYAAASVLAFFLLASTYLYFDSEIESELLPINNQEIVKDDINNSVSNPIESVNQTEEIIEKNNQETVVSNDAIETEENISQELNQMVFEEEIITTAIIDHSISENAQVIEEIIREATPEILSSEKEYVFEEQAQKEELENASQSNNASKAGYDFFDDDAIDDITAGHRNEKFWELGFEFSPEWVTIPDNSTNIKAYGLDLSAKHHFGKWFVETGIGVAFSKDDGLYQVDYQEALFKGSYQDVYNVTFDTSNNQVTPTYYTKLVNIYDTIDRVTISENKNSYVYLNIPINFGYYTKLGNKFSFYSKLGLNGSFLIFKDIPEIQISGDNTNILKVTPLYYERTGWHMQAQISVGINYHITEKFLFGVEPNARYYIKSLVETNNSGNPYGLGVKIGFKYIIK